MLNNKEFLYELNNYVSPAAGYKANICLSPFHHRLQWLLAVLNWFLLLLVACMCLLLLYSKLCLKPLLKKDRNDKWKLNECRTYCRMHPLEHSAILVPCT